MAEPGRNFSTNIYRYGFNGMEKDDEWKGSGDFKNLVKKISRDIPTKHEKKEKYVGRPNF